MGRSKVFKRLYPTCEAKDPRQTKKKDPKEEGKNFFSDEL